MCCKLLPTVINPNYLFILSTKIILFTIFSYIPSSMVCNLYSHHTFHLALHPCKTIVPPKKFGYIKIRIYTLLTFSIYPHIYYLIISLSSSSEIICIPKLSALVNLVPASSPASTYDVFLLTLPETLPP
ncbi:MAG: hypothetical protein K0R54_3331 [Clostridiaceae bacterium]|nr:hypothetical protein [Clostridiaceae bacterium]